jgi:hypothetical protein
MSLSPLPTAFYNIILSTRDVMGVSGKMAIESMDLRGSGSAYLQRSKDHLMQLFRYSDEGFTTQRRPVLLV